MSESDRKLSVNPKGIYLFDSLGNMSRISVLIEAL